MQTVVKYDDADPNWDMLVSPFTSCVSYVKDLSPLNYGDQARPRHTYTCCYETLCTRHPEPFSTKPWPLLGLLLFPQHMHGIWPC